MPNQSGARRYIELEPTEIKLNAVSLRLTKTNFDNYAGAASAAPVALFGPDCVIRW
jgi:hypothetical protein